MMRASVSLVRLAILICLPAAAGCGGHYIVTVGDQLAPAGGEAATVVRLQRNDFFILAPPVNEALIGLQVADGKQRGAYTDKLGYAGTTVPVPAQAGRYVLRVAHLDRWGDEVTVEAPVYVWAPDRPAVAVDMDCLPGLVLGSPKQGARAIQKLAGGANLLYLTRRGTGQHAQAHEQLHRAGYPDGPILAWQREQWHIVREEGWRIPRIVVENRLISQLPEIRKAFPNLKLGVCGSALAAKAFAEAGMEMVIVGSAGWDGKAAVRRHGSWAELADRGP